MDAEKDKRLEFLAPTEPEPCSVRRAGAGMSGGTSDRRAQIIEATMRLIARDGVAALSTRKIAREAPVNLATLHDLFGSKDGLLLAVLDAATSGVIGALVIDVHPGEGLRAALVESFAVLCALLDRVPALPLVRCDILLYAGRRPAVTTSAQRQQQRYLDALQTYYRVAGAPGELGLIASDDLAVAVGNSVDGLALLLAMGTSFSQQQATRQQVLRALLSLVPRSPAGPAASDDQAPLGGQCA